MRKIVILIMVSLFLGCMAATVMAESAPPKVVELANTELVKIGTDPVIVSAVKAENAKGKTLEQIKAKDEQWKATAGIADYMQVMFDSECGQRLRAIQSGAGYFAEIFVMDNQGANVAMTDKTSDYWQGDEAKFQKSYNNGAGSVFIDDVEFDDSAQAYLVQVSVPVKDGDAVIGAITFGIDVDKVN